MSVKITGADKLLRKLDALSKQGAKRALRKATTAGVAVLRKAVRDATPVDDGKLKKAQTSKVTGKGLGLRGIVGADVAKLQADHDADKDRPTNIDYLVEFGHTTPDGRIVPPSGYMRRAADSAMPAAEAAFTARLAVEIEREASR